MSSHLAQRQLKFGDYLIKLDVFADPDQEFQRHFDEEAAADAREAPEPPLYGCLWPSAEGLAQYLWQRKAELKGQSVLEIGCGLGLPSLLCAAAGAEVTAMDHHPGVRQLLDRNVEANGLPQLAFFQGSFADPKINLGRFSLIIGSDILYEPDRYQELESFILRHAQGATEVVLADPGRFAVHRFGPTLKQVGRFELLHQALPGQPHPIEIHRFQLARPQDQERQA
jgi:predicted nicotinamide N-methyase